MGVGTPLAPGEVEFSLLVPTDRPPRVPARDLRKALEDASADGSGGREGAQSCPASFAVSCSG